MTPSPSQSNIQKALRNFLLAVLPSGTEIFEGQDNRVGEPETANFVVMTTIRRDRLATNLDTSADVKFTASITGATMTVTAVDFGVIAVGATVFGPGVAANTTIISGPGGAGTYTVSPSQTIGSETMSAGATGLMQSTDVVVQLDVHSPDVSTAADMAQTISTAFRDGYAVTQFATSGFDVTPLYADDPRQVPFLNAEQAYETRYSVDVHLQANQAIAVPQTYADGASAAVIDVNAVYPPI